MNPAMRTLICMALLGASMATLADEEITLTPALFVDQVAQGGMTEMALGRLALKKSESPAVQEFAQLMIDHHDKAGRNSPPLPGPRVSSRQPGPIPRMRL